MTPRPAAILLDGMGTLVRLRPPVPVLRAELARRFGIEVSAAEAARALAAEIAYYRAHLQEGADADGVARLRARCAEVLRAALPSSERLARVGRAELTDTLLAALRFEAFPDVRPALERVREGGLRAVVVSNWDASLHDVLARLELDPLLDGIVTSAQARARKPDPEIFALALATAGCEAGEALHVGDSVEEDVVGARAAGIPVLLLVRDGAIPPAGVRSIASLAELAALT